MEGLDRRGRGVARPSDAPSGAAVDSAPLWFFAGAHSRSSAVGLCSRAAVVAALEE